MKTIQTWLDKFPHWLYLGLALAVGVFWQNLKDQPDFVTAITTWNPKFPERPAISGRRHARRGHRVAQDRPVGREREQARCQGRRGQTTQRADDALPAYGVRHNARQLPHRLAGRKRLRRPTNSAAGTTDLTALAACVSGDVVLAEDVVEWILSSKQPSKISTATADTVKLNIAADRAVRVSAHK